MLACTLRVHRAEKLDQSIRWLLNLTVLASLAVEILAPLPRLQEVTQRTLKEGSPRFRQPAQAARKICNWTIWASKRPRRSLRSHQGKQASPCLFEAGPAFLIF